MINWLHKLLWMSLLQELRILNFLKWEILSVHVARIDMEVQKHKPTKKHSLSKNICLTRSSSCHDLRILLTG